MLRNRYRPKLTSPMQKALRDLLRGDECKHRGTVKALQERNLMSEYGHLTQSGRDEALVLVPLQEQCEYLKIECRQRKALEWKEYPEIALWNAYRREGWVGGFCEGGPILLLIRSAALDTLARLNTFESREDACRRFTEAQLKILSDKADRILGAIRRASAEQVAKNFEEIYSWGYIQEWYPGLAKEAIRAIYNAIGPDRLAEITEAIMEDPYAYRSGWPDLTMTKNGDVLWIEVKTTDRLHLSQIRILQRMKPLLPGELLVEVLPVKAKSTDAASNYALERSDEH